MKDQIKNILVTIDFTEKSNNALEMAVHMAKRHKARIILFHNINSFYVIDRTGKQVIGADTIQENFGKTEKSLNDLKFSLQTQHNLHFESIVKSDSLLNSINDVIYEENIDLVITGTSGRQKFLQLFLGSTSYEILTGANCSVLLVPENCNKYIFEKILVPVRVLDHLNDKLDISLSIAEKNKGVISLLGISSEDDLLEIKEAYQLLKKNLSNETAEYTSEFLLTRDKAVQISKFSKDDDADIIILNYHDEESWKSIFSENFLKQIINKTDIPLFFLKHKTEIKKTDTEDNAGFDITLPCPG